MTPPPAISRLTNFLIALLLIALIPAQSAAQNNIQILFNSQYEASQWNVFEHDSSQGPSGYQPNQDYFFLASKTSAYMQRNVVIDAKYYTRMIVDLEIDSEIDMSGMVGVNFYFSETDMITPEAMVGVLCPEKVRTHVIFELDQSLLWKGTITTIRLDPALGKSNAKIYSITFDNPPPPPIAPSWQFTSQENLLGWYVGEYLLNGKFNSPRQQITSNGLAMTATDNSPVLINFNVSINSDNIEAAEIVVRNLSGNPTKTRLHWMSDSMQGFNEENRAQVKLSPGSEWQTVRIPLKGVPNWKGQINGLLINPVRQPGPLEVRSFRFIPITGTNATTTSQLKTLNWRTHAQADAQIRAGMKTPMLVLITKDGNRFSEKIESELASNAQFLQMSQKFFPVRIDAQSPIVPKAFGKITRIPVLVIMTYDYQKQRWVEDTRLIGKDVSRNAVSTLEPYDF